ncbi:MAG: GntR family transcriptional regulator [Deltaproteobacteria bacterium HGW-Deltaproteobacteria-8]|jgi:GntR family transcriptional regulator|nr:MAG: GntR family transcriptional regulator [Deltaproteobacteria bacterium HGW-Deltaproteobacteria-8]
MKPQFRPLYRQVKESLLRRIASGEWTPGTFLPSESALAEEYEVSHGTLRTALNELTAEHRVVRYQGKGTAVATFDADETMFRFFRMQDAAGQRTLPTSKAYLAELGAAREDEAEAFSIPLGAPVFRIERVRLLDHTPVLNEYISLNCVHMPGVEHLASLHTLPNTLYNLFQVKYNITIAKAKESITAVSANESDVKRLGVKFKVPLLAVRRLAYDINENIIELRYTRCVTDVFCYYTELS